MAAAISMPRIVVLLATYNGLRWLPEQLASILSQQGVSLQVVALDDESTDGTREWLLEQASKDTRLVVLPRQGRSGGSASNFYRLVAQVNLDEGVLAAFSDQDDVWQPGKLARHAALLAQGGHDGISSNVTSFSPAGQRRLIRKDFPQRPFDYLFESPGPGSTFLITPRLLRLVASTLASTPAAREVEFHDSLIYAIARAHGWSWHIDGLSSVDYRQHDDNVMGSNVGVGPALARLRLIRDRWFRNHAARLARVAIEVAPSHSRRELERMFGLITSGRLRSRLSLASRASELRRRPRDQRIIALLIAIGAW
jgi:rhamnosyltransferase